MNSALELQPQPLLNLHRVALQRGREIGVLPSNRLAEARVHQGGAVLKSALQIGHAAFRAGELRSLTPASFDLDSDSPTVIVAAAHSKRRREDRQPIRQDLADLLRPWLATRPEGERVFAKLPGDTARMLRSDLAAARQEWIDEAPAQAERRCGRNPTSWHIATRPAKWPTSIRPGTLTFLASWPAGHRSRRAKSLPGIAPEPDHRPLLPRPIA